MAATISADAVVKALDEVFSDESAGKTSALMRVCDTGEVALSIRIRECLVGRMVSSFECVYGEDGDIARKFRAQTGLRLERLEEKERTARKLDFVDALPEERWAMLRYLCACGIAGHLAVLYYDAEACADRGANVVAYGRSSTPGIIADDAARAIERKRVPHLLRVAISGGVQRVVEDHPIDDGKDSLTVGRLAGRNDIATTEASAVSGTHLRIERKGAGWKVVQDKTRNGTLVILPNGQRRFLAMEGSCCGLDHGSYICCAPLCTPEGDRALNYDNGAVFKFEIE